MASRNEQSIIDYTMVRKAERRIITDVRIKRGYEIGSDHYLLETTLKYNKEAEEKQREYEGSDEGENKRV